MTDLPPLCDECGGTGQTVSGGVCPVCDGWGTDPEQSLIEDDVGDDDDGDD